MAPLKKETTYSPQSNLSPSKAAAIGQYQPKTLGWTPEDKSALFAHVRKHGETNWGQAVSGKTSKQVSHLRLTGAGQLPLLFLAQRRVATPRLTSQSSEQWK